MKNIIIITSSIRQGRLSNRVAPYIKNYIQNNPNISCEIIDLKEYNFPIFEERLMFQKNPSPELLDYVEKFNSADGVIIVSSVYNQSFPASLKNVIDVLNSEWKRKVVGLVSTTVAPSAGISTLFQLENILSKLGAIISPTKHAVTSIEKEFAEDGSPIDKEKTEKSFSPMLNDFIWLVEKLK